MNLKQDFEFDTQVSTAFDDMVQRSVPFYPELQRMTVELAQCFAKPGTSIVDIGCSTGETLSLLARALPDSLTLIGIDNSEPMLEEARKKLSGAGTLRRCILRNQDINEGLHEKNVALVTMNWTLQFVRPLQRDYVLKSIHDSLMPQGALIIMEKVLADHSLLSRLYISNYHDFKKRNGYSESEIAEKRERLENVLIPYRIDENIEILKRNGFTMVDTFFRWYNWAGFLAIKAPAT
jgi:tRNA (cmo5U34)-methyltransferase